MDPFLAWAKRLWDAWDARVLVLVSFILQVVLTISGSRRKYVAGIWIRIIVWCAYLMADWVATVAIGKLSKIGNNDPKHRDNTIDPSTVVRALWAPLLLLHLGGPDTITAYSMEDNSLWVRHLLGLAVQVVVAIYVILRCWSNSWLSILTIPLFLAGIIKYGERTWALCYSIKNRIHKKDGIFVVEDGLRLSLGNFSGGEFLVEAYFLFDSFDPYGYNLKWAGKVWSASRDRAMNSWSYSVLDDSCKDVFKMTEIGLGFMYDEIYTKAKIIDSRAGCSLRFISLLCSVSALCGFSVAAKPGHANVDVVITYVLLVGAVVLEIYAVILFMYSDWATIWMIRHRKKPLVTRLLQVLAPQPLSKRRWSNSMGQFSLLSFCIDKPIWEIKKFSRIQKMEVMIKFKKHWLTTRVHVPENLKETTLQIIRELEPQIISDEQLFTKRGECALERYNCPEDFKWSVEGDFGQSITTWHIATDICYNNSDKDSQSEMCRLLSDYMTYLFVKCPSMLPIAAGDAAFDMACSEIGEPFKERPSIRERVEACKILQTENFLRGMIAEVQELTRHLMGRVDKWKIISSVWVEMLCFAASQCQVNDHVQHLRRGGELITHVWLLLFFIRHQLIKIPPNLDSEAN